MAFNSDPDSTYQKDLNAFTHLTEEEFISTRCGAKLPDSADNQTDITPDDARIAYPFGNYTSDDAPSYTDFSSLMQPIQNQLSCGACWAFTVMAQLDKQHAFNGTLIPLQGLLKIKDSSYSTVLAPQFLLDCNLAQSGCVGGWPTSALSWLKTAFGGNNKAPPQLLYPYRAGVKTCRKTLSTVNLGITQVREIFFGGDEDAMKAQIANNGPTIAAIYVTSNLQSYASGVFYDAKCPSGNTCTLFNHAVVIVGYGTDQTLGDYWLVKNSWGPDWGEDGYIRMARNKSNNCNIACYAMFAQ
ncbi:crustapain-like [Chironomus tepperi]|uniref:crustapain-like n=1 Tax=Chironomus tepperi TaxID=113505 RepID=UPI00391F48FF